MENVIAALSASVDPGSLIRGLAQQTCVFTPKAQGATVSLYTPSRGFAFVSTHGLVEPLLGLVVPPTGTFHAAALEARRPHACHDVSCDQRVPPQMRNVAAVLNIRSWVVVPLHHRGIELGTLSVVASDPHAFTEVDIAGAASTGRFLSALLGSRPDMFNHLDGGPSSEPTGHPSPAGGRFLSSVLTPNRAAKSRMHRRLDALLSDQSNLRAVFQPIVDLQTRQTWAFEGLTRFPRDADLDVGQWFDTARELGRDASLELMAMQVVLTAAQHIPREVLVAVNLSPTIAMNPVSLRLLGDSPRPVIIELTEHEPFPDDLNEGLKALRDSDVKIAIDDAGAGFASLDQLARLRPDIIKIDGGLTAGSEADPVKRAMMAAIVQLASEWNARVIAEAVENARQLDALRSLGINHGQGYFLGRPCPLESLSFA
ncbi:EAL domain-containing protein [Mycobacterium sp. 236(2023)]|uniref:sensor domain-containing phosphodiesterase n=1 Tax=Mycobacterium sp. 236(2023) TaxID=3038163 RepID=UPI0024154A32|nr:EAL domain-containing protein [Mycobacterium sp. 236(2023)]MDG4667917.1 EAL domain-containing protein [Mycobacterium sp. 236(2023)]